jgi:hypothetical protein
MGDLGIFIAGEGYESLNKKSKTMAKKQEFNIENIKQELGKIDLENQITQYHEIGEWLHKKLEDRGRQNNELQRKLSKEPKPQNSGN